MHLKTLMIAAAAMMFAGAAAAQPASPAPAPAAPPASGSDLIVTLRNAGQFTTFLRVLNSVNLHGLLKTQPGLTLFAPTDAAFAAMPAGALDALSANKPALQKRLMHHIINAKILSTNIKGAQEALPTGAGDTMLLDGLGPVLKADNASIVQTDIPASNGVIQVVDQVLSPMPAPAPAAATPPAKAGPG